MRFAVYLLPALALCLLPGLQAQTPDRFAPYERCKFGDDLQLVESTPLADGVEGRTVKTIMGPRQVPLAGGTRLMYAYPHTDFFANVKVERIPAKDYKQAKQDLIANFEQILAGDDSSTRNYELKPTLHGLEIAGLDRRKLEGGVLGIYLFFVDRTHTATTIYFLNQDPGMRKFDNLEDYAKLRDAFLESYTDCASGHPHPAAQSRVAAAATAEAVSPAAMAASPSVAGETPPVSTASLPDAPIPQGTGAAPPTAPANASDAAGATGSAKPATPAKSTHVQARRSSVKAKGAATKKTARAHTAAKRTASKTKTKKTDSQ